MSNRPQYCTRCRSQWVSWPLSPTLAGEQWQTVGRPSNDQSNRELLRRLVVIKPFIFDAFTVKDDFEQKQLILNSPTPNTHAHYRLLHQRLEVETIFETLVDEHPFPLWQLVAVRALYSGEELTALDRNTLQALVAGPAIAEAGVLWQTYTEELASSPSSKALRSESALSGRDLVRRLSPHVQ